MTSSLARLGATAAIAALTLVGTAHQALAQFSFSDHFNPAPSALWNNASGNWTATGGDYAAQQPNNNPIAATQLPFDLPNDDLRVTVTVNNLADAGIFLDSTGPGLNGVLLVLGGEGYGQGNRGGPAGNSVYWQVVQGGVFGGIEDISSGVFAPGNTYTITAIATGDSYSAYVDPDGSFDVNSVLLTQLTDSTFFHGGVGLYDDQPNTTTGNGVGPPTSFSDFNVTDDVAPEPGSLALLGAGVLILPVRKRILGHRRA